MATLVSIVEDDQATREGFVKLLRHAPEIVCLATYSSGEEALRKIPQNLPHVLLLDINLPGCSGVECAAALKRSFPELQILMVTTYEESDRIFSSLRAGASGYLLKRSAPNELVSAITEVREGGSPMSMQIARKVVAHFHQSEKTENELETLTRRENEILALLAKGYPYKQIADELNITRGTVHCHLHKIYAKLHVQSRMEAVTKFRSA